MGVIVRVSPSATRIVSTSGCTYVPPSKAIRVLSGLHATRVEDATDVSRVGAPPAADATVSQNPSCWTAK